MSLCLFIIRLNYLLALLKDVAMLVAAGDRLQYSRGRIQSLLLCNFLQLEIMQIFLTLNLRCAWGVVVFQFLISTVTNL